MVELAGIALHCRQTLLPHIFHNGFDSLLNIRILFRRPRPHGIQLAAFGKTVRFYHGNHACPPNSRSTRDKKSAISFLYSFMDAVLTMSRADT